MTICSFWTKRDLSFGDRTGQERYVRLPHSFFWHVLGILGRYWSPGGNSVPWNPKWKSSTIHSIELNYKTHILLESAHMFETFVNVIDLFRNLHVWFHRPQRSAIRVRHLDLTQGGPANSETLLCALLVSFLYNVGKGFSFVNLAIEKKIIFCLPRHPELYFES